MAKVRLTLLSESRSIEVPIYYVNFFYISIFTVLVFGVEIRTAFENEPRIYSKTFQLLKRREEYVDISLHFTATTPLSGDRNSETNYFGPQKPEVEIHPRV